MPSVFVRASGCNLRCVWCDTPYASWNPDGVEMSVDQILDRAKQFVGRHAVVTGGEPMIMPDVAELCSQFKSAGYHVTVETAGTVYAPAPMDLASISPKLSNSTPVEREGGKFAAAHDRQRINVPVIQQLMDEAGDFQLKFVVSSEDDPFGDPAAARPAESLESRRRAAHARGDIRDGVGLALGMGFGRLQAGRLSILRPAARAAVRQSPRDVMRSFGVIPA